MEDLAGWIAPIATMIAAIMTAANLGTRITGWGFVVFTVGSIVWSLVAIATGQQNLLLTNGFLTLVNIIGIWRWLGRQARYEDGSAEASQRSAAARVPSLFSAGAMVGMPVTDRDGTSIATVVDVMMHCDGNDIAYLVVNEGGVAGVGETVHALDPAWVTFASDGISTTLVADALRALAVLEADKWPEALPQTGPVQIISFRVSRPATGRCPPRLSKGTRSWQSRTTATARSASGKLRRRWIGLRPMPNSRSLMARRRDWAARPTRLLGATLKR